MFRTTPRPILVYNDFIDRIGFGGPALKNDDPVEQIKQVKYRDGVASAIMPHNAADLTELLSDLAADQGMGRSAYRRWRRSRSGFRPNEALH